MVALIKEVLPEVANMLPNWIVVLVDIAAIFILAWLLYIAINRATKLFVKLRSANETETRLKRTKTAASVIVSVSKYVIMFIAIAAAVGELGLKSAMNSMLAAAGIGGIALSFGAQSLVKDMFTGMFMLFEDQISVGDYVRIGDIEGTVENVGLRTTTIKNYTGELSIIPNGSIGTLTNYTRSDGMVCVNVTITYESDTERALEAMFDECRRFAENSDGIAWNPQQVGVTGLTDAGVALRVTVNVKPTERWSVERKLLQNVKERFDKDGIAVSYQKFIVLKANGE